MAEIQPVYCGNFEYEASERDVMKLFEKFGPVERIDMKTGFAFVYMKNKKDADDAIYDLDRREWGYRRPRPLKVEWAKKTEGTKEQQNPTKTLFVVNFDTRRTTIRDLEDFYNRYGRLRRVDIKRNYAFVEYDELRDAIDAQKATHLSNFHGRTVTVEFVQGRDNKDERGGGGDRGGGGRDYDRGRGRSRSRSPPKRRRSPDYDGNGYPEPDRRDRGRRDRDGGASPPPPRRADSGSPGRRQREAPRRERSRSPEKVDREGGPARSGGRSLSRSPR